MQRWLLRGVLVGGAVGSALLLAGPAQAADRPASPLGGLTAGLTDVVDDGTGSVLDVVSGTVGSAVPAVAQAPVLAQLPVVPAVTEPVGTAVTGTVGTATDTTSSAVAEVTATVRTTVVPVARQVDTVVAEVVDVAPVLDPVVDVLPAPVEALPAPDEVLEPGPAEGAAGMVDAVVPDVVAPGPASARAVENDSAATGFTPLLGPVAVVGPGDQGATDATPSATLATDPRLAAPAPTAVVDRDLDGRGSPSPSDHRDAPVPPATSSSATSGSSPVGADQPARSTGRPALPSGTGVGRTPVSDHALVPAGALSPPFAPD